MPAFTLPSEFCTVQVLEGVDLVGEACQHSHYPVNFVQSRYYIEGVKSLSGLWNG